ncbi:MAG: hypothetical protein J5601_06630 [Elusimicrobiaceae bacterium]|nr:hypothetical protein [Elusimicrobiaceae bacterium]
MKVEIKKISISSLLFSVFPLAVFVIMLVSAFLEVFSPDATINLTYVMSLIMHAIQSTLLFWVSAIFFVLVYNVFTALGIRGIHVYLEDK